MNDLVDMVNKQIVSQHQAICLMVCIGMDANPYQQDAVQRAGPTVKFLDYDHYVGELGGRICEKGVNEQTSASNSRYVYTYNKRQGCGEWTTVTDIMSTAEQDSCSTSSTRSM